MIRSGELRHVIAIQAATETRDSMGGVSVTWADVTGMSAVRAAIYDISAKERIANAQQEMTITHRITIRYIAGITAKHRIKWGSRYFGINSIVNLGNNKNRALMLLCEEEEANTSAGVR